MVFKATSVAQGATKSPAPRESEIETQLDVMLKMSAELGFSGRGRVLDLGCGIGNTVSALLKRGCDAYGVDVGEWWGKDHAAYWHDSLPPSENVRARLSVTSEENYRLPYPDNYFDLIISSQVFEHVFNYTDVFRELGRVLKRSGASIHVFPGRGTPTEPHLGIPFVPFAKHSWWLLLWSLVARRHRATWSDEYHFLKIGMTSNNYPSRGQLRAHASAAAVRIGFREDLYLRHSNSRPSRILETAKRLHMGWIESILTRLCQRTMVLTKSRTST